jgi:glucose/arabinose dehydrogenase
VSIGAGLEGPAGLEASVYAKGPATLATVLLDRQGRLWLAAAGLETHTEDGVYEISKPGAPAVKVISGLSDPLGLAWYQNELFVSSIGRVDEYGGFDGRRFTSHARILSGPVAGGENNILVMAPDGRFTMGVTASCDHCAPRSEWSGSIVSFKPDGSDLRLYAKRIRAPYGLAYFPGTSDLLVTMNQRDDLGAATPGDLLALVRQGQDWRSPGCYGQGGAACIGVPAPIAVLDKHAAVGDVVIGTGEPGASVGSWALVAEWQSAKVQRVALSRSGSTYKGSVTPFLTGIRNPLAVAPGPDQSLLVGDWSTGTIYEIQPKSS